MSMYRVSTNPAGEKQWWSPDDNIPTSHRFIRSATYEEAVIIDVILHENSLGKMPSDRWGKIITTLMNAFRPYILFTGGNDIFLTGPFKTHKEASEYGPIAEKRLWNNDPNWRCIELKDTYGLRVDAQVDFNTEPHLYIVVTRETDVYLVGPFDDADARRDYGATAQKELWEDDPHWKTIDVWNLSETKDLRIEAPDDITVVPGAYNLACGLNADGSGIEPKISGKLDPKTPVVVLKANDVYTPPHLIADGIIIANQGINLFDLAMTTNTIGYKSVDWTDLIAEDGSIESLLMEVTRTPKDGPAITERFSIRVPYSFSDFNPILNSAKSGDRKSEFKIIYNLPNDELGMTTDDKESCIFTRDNDIDGVLVLAFRATLNLKTSYARGLGAIVPILAESEIAKELTFEIIGWKPRLFFATPKGVIRIHQYESPLQPTG